MYGSNQLIIINCVMISSIFYCNENAITRNKISNQEQKEKYIQKNVLYKLFNSCIIFNKSLYHLFFKSCFCS